MLTIVHITYHDETNIGSLPDRSGTGGFENADGNGEIHCFRIFDGVSVMLLRLEMETYTEIRTQVGMMRSTSASTDVLKPAFPCAVAFC